MPKENPVIAFLNKMADLILLNLIFLLCCIPVVTIGPAITALYAVSLRSVRYGDGYVIQTFFRSFKQNFKQSFVAGMISRYDHLFQRYSGTACFLLICFSGAMWDLLSCPYL